MNLLAGLLIFTIVLVYAVGWLLVAMRTRLDMYIHLLEAVLKRQT